MKQIIFSSFILFLSVCFFSCGSGDETNWDQTTPEGLSRLVFAEMVNSETLYEDYRQPPFDCASDYYFGSENIVDYYGNENISIANCQKLKSDAQKTMYTRLENIEFVPTHFNVDDQGYIQSTTGTDALPYVEGTLYLNDNSTVHFNRLVQHNGLWYVLVLTANQQVY